MEMIRKMRTSELLCGLLILVLLVIAPSVIAENQAIKDLVNSYSYSSHLIFTASDHNAS